VSRADTRSTHLDTTLFSIQRGRSRLSSQSGLNNFDDQLGQPRRCARGREREALATSITHHHPILSTQTEKKTPHDRCSPGHQSTRSPFQLDQPIPCGNLDQPGRYVRDRKWEAPAASITHHHPLLSTQTHKKRHTTLSQDGRHRCARPSGSTYILPAVTLTSQDVMCGTASGRRQPRASPTTTQS
jgi:hypothetical protein